MRRVEIVAPGGRPERSSELLALLVLHPDGLSSRDIARLLWPRMPGSRASHNLRMAAYVLRRTLGCKAALRHSGEMYQLDPHLEVWADVRVFDAALTRARLGAAGNVRAELEEALDICRGALLAGVDADWVDVFRMAYRERTIGVLLRLAELVDDRAAADALAERALSIDPSNEGAFERLIANARAGHDFTRLRRTVDRYAAAVAGVGLQPNPLLVQHTSPASSARR